MVKVKVFLSSKICDFMLNFFFTLYTTLLALTIHITIYLVHNNNTDLVPKRLAIIHYITRYHVTLYLFCSHKEKTSLSSLDLPLSNPLLNPLPIPAFSIHNQASVIFARHQNDKKGWVLYGGAVRNAFSALNRECGCSKRTNLI